MKGYELLGRHLKLFTDKVEVNEKFSIGDELAEQLKAARERAGLARHEPSGGNNTKALIEP